MKEYYDLYLKGPNEEKCKVCGEVCFWENSTKGYVTYCSKKCMRNDPDYNDNHKSGVNAQDKHLAAEKRRSTVMKMYGVETVSQIQKVKDKIRETCLSRYGVDSTTSIGHVKEARIKSLEENSYEINKKRKKWWKDPKNIQKVINTRKSNLMELYDVQSVSQIEYVRNIIKDTNRKKYKSDWIVESEHFRNEMQNNGRWTPIEEKEPWDQYCYYVSLETKKHIRDLFADWDGRCYYFGHKLSNENGKYDPYSITIDHKISKKYGYSNNIAPEVIGSRDNLCICSRLINCVKNSLTEEEFLDSDLYIKYKESIGHYNDE